MKDLKYSVRLLLVEEYLNGVVTFNYVKDLNISSSTEWSNTVTVCSCLSFPNNKQYMSNIFILSSKVV